MTMQSYKRFIDQIISLHKKQQCQFIATGSKET